jgi:hypothetical protein
MALQTVQDYVTQARVLLLDEIEPYRYTDVQLIDALNMAIEEARRLRPDLFTTFFRTSLPDFTTSDLSDPVPVDAMYRKAFLHYIVGHSHLRDEENTQDSRAAAMLNSFVAKLTTIQA